MQYDEADDIQPSPNGSNGRQVGGRFAAGNSHGKGNPHAKQTALLREALLSAVTPDDVVAVVRSLLEQAKMGNVPAARELLDRTCGRVQVLELELANAQQTQAIKMYGVDAPIDAV
jgi:hypothetical protein